MVCCVMWLRYFSNVFVVFLDTGLIFSLCFFVSLYHNARSTTAQANNACLCQRLLRCFVVVSILGLRLPLPLPVPVPVSVPLRVP